MQEIRKVDRLGLPVHWVQVTSCARFLVRRTSSELKGEIRLKPHLCEDAMHFRSLVCETHDAAAAGKAWVHKAQNPKP